MGRAPWAGTIEGRDDWHAVLDALDAADVRHLATRRYTALSGGEKARVSLARVLAQQTPIVFLDEPTASLDLRHQEDVMRLGRRMADDGRAVVVVVHDLSLAAAYADRLAIIAGRPPRGRRLTAGGAQRGARRARLRAPGRAAPGERPSRDRARCADPRLGVNPIHDI